jgi:hypothetical protein
MLRFRIHDILLGAILGVATLGMALFAMGFVLGSSQYSGQPTQSQSPEKTNGPESKNEQQEPWGQRAVTDPIAVFTLCLVIVGAFQVGLFYVQLKIIRESLADAKIAADAATKAADAAQQSATATTASVKLAGQTAKRQLRAYVFVDSARFEPPPAPNSPWYIRVTLRNFGQTPAYSVVVKCEKEICATKDENIIPPFSTNVAVHPPAIMPPGHPHLALLVCEELCNYQAWNSLVQAGKNAYIWGHVDYIDAFAKRRFTTFYSVCHPAVAYDFAYCKSGNDADHPNNEE